MSGLALSAIVLAALWLGVLTLVMVLVVRQLAILTARFEMAGSRISPGADGLEVGRQAPVEVLSALPELRTRVGYVLVLSATCAPCRELAPNLAELSFTEPVTALVPGRAELADSLAQLLPGWMRVVRDPEAMAIANALQVRTTPFAMEIEGGFVTGKAFLHAAADLRRLAEARRTGARKLSRRLGVQGVNADVS